MNAQASLPAGLMTASVAAQYLNLTQKTLAQWRALKKGPPYLKRGRIFYLREDLDAWLLASRTVPASSDDSKGSQRSFEK